MKTIKKERRAKMKAIVKFLFILLFIGLIIEFIDTSNCFAQDKKKKKKDKKKDSKIVLLVSGKKQDRDRNFPIAVYLTKGKQNEEDDKDEEDKEEKMGGEEEEEEENFYTPNVEIYPYPSYYSSLSNAHSAFLGFSSEE